MQFVLNLDLNGAAFDDADGHQGYELSRILSEVAAVVDGARFQESDKLGKVSLHDINGNFCGDWQVVADAPVKPAKPVKAKRKLPYFILLERDSKSSPWGLAFGAIYRADVESEYEDRRDHDVRASDLKIVQVDGRDAAATDAAIAKLNGSAAAAAPSGRFFADLNPRFGQKGQKRYAVLYRVSPSDLRETGMHYATRRAAEAAAAKSNEQVS